MRASTLIFALMVAAACAVRLPAAPQVVETAEVTTATRQPRFVEDIISSVLENVSNEIRDAGLDPIIHGRSGLAYELPVPVLFTLDAVVENLIFTGLSNIVINRIDFSLLSQRLTLDISLPEISLFIGRAACDAVALGYDINLHVNGRFSIIEPRVSGDVVLNILGGAIGGPLIRSMNLEFDLGGIEYNGRVNILGTDLTQQVRTFLSQNIPNAIAQKRAEINELVEIIAWELLNEILG